MTVVLLLEMAIVVVAAQDFPVYTWCRVKCLGMMFTRKNSLGSRQIQEEESKEGTAMRVKLSRNAFLFTVVMQRVGVTRCSS